MAVPLGVSPIHRVELTPTDASTVAVPAATAGTARSQARASETYSVNASSSRISATTKNTIGGANQTTPIAIAMSTAPLRTRVMPPPFVVRRSNHELARLVLRQAQDEREQP